MVLPTLNDDNRVLHKRKDTKRKKERIIKWVVIFFYRILLNNPPSFNKKDVRTCFL
jgi:hypothetical protein